MSRLAPMPDAITFIGLPRLSPDRLGSACVALTAARILAVTIGRVVQPPETD